VKGEGKWGPGLNHALAHCPGPRRVACISLTASSIEEPQPSLRISTPKILAAAMAPYSLAPAMVTSKGRIWSEYQGLASSLRPPTSETVRLSSASMVEPTDGPIVRTRLEVNTAWAPTLAS
jgi:hypothetical protein